MVTTGDSLHVVKGAGLSICNTDPPLWEERKQWWGWHHVFAETNALCAEKGRHIPGSGLGVGSDGLLAFTDFFTDERVINWRWGWGEEFVVHGTIHNLKHEKAFVGKMKEVWRERRFWKEGT